MGDSDPGTTPLETLTFGGTPKRTPEEVLFPSVKPPFKIISHGEFLSLPKGCLRWLQENAFPGSYDVVCMPPFLLVCYEVLPKKPWPLSVASAPVFITDRADRVRFEVNKATEPIPGRFSVLDQFDATRMLHSKVFRQVRNYFVADAPVKANSVLWVAGKWVIGVPPMTKASCLPDTAAKAPCTYRGCDSAEVDPHVRRWTASRKHADGFDGDTASEILHPGLLISSGPDRFGVEVLSASGVFVEDLYRNEYMTVSASAFSSRNGPVVFRPNTSGRPIAQIVRSDDGTDIGLAKLDNKASYINYTGDIHSIPQDGSFNFTTTVRQSDSVPMYSVLSMNSPALGFVNCIKIGRQEVVVARPRPTKSGMEGLFMWAEIDWYYFGNGLVETEPTFGSAGCPIVDENGNLVSLFKGFLKRYQGCGTGTSVSSFPRCGLYVTDKVPGVLG